MTSCWKSSEVLASGGGGHNLLELKEIEIG